MLNFIRKIGYTMKKYIVCLYILFQFLATNAKTPEIENPLYLFNTLMECNSEECMGNICKENGFQELPSENYMHRFKFSDGTIYSFRMDTIDSKKIYPYITVTTNKKKKDLEKILLESGYVKEGEIFVKGNSFCKHKRICKIVKNKDSYEMIFKKNS